MYVFTSFLKILLCFAVGVVCGNIAALIPYLIPTYLWNKDKISDKAHTAWCVISLLIFAIVAIIGSVLMAYFIKNNIHFRGDL